MTPVRGTCPDLVTPRAGQMICDALAVRTQAQAVGKTLSRFGEFARLGAIKIHAEDLTDLIPHHLDQHPLIADQQRGGVEHGLSLIHISEPTRLLSISYAVFCL